MKNKFDKLGEVLLKTPFENKFKQYNKFICCSKEYEKIMTEMDDENISDMAIRITIQLREMQLKIIRDQKIKMTREEKLKIAKTAYRDICDVIDEFSVSFENDITIPYPNHIRVDSHWFSTYEITSETI